MEYVGFLLLCYYHLRNSITYLVHFILFFSGKIKYFTCPPENFSPTTHLAASIVTDMAKEFSLDDADFNKNETKDIDQLPSVRPSATVVVETMGFFEGNSEPQAAMECDDGDGMNAENAVN